MGLDLGTSAIKGTVIDGAGNDVAVATKSSTLTHPRDGWVEQDPDVCYDAVCSVIRELVAAAPGPITAVAMAAASGNTLLTDANGEPLTPIINWMDQRAVSDLPKALTGLQSEAVRAVVGWPCINSFPLAHLAWWQEHDQARYRRAAHYSMNTDWLLFRLTGTWAMDHSTATTFHLQDQVTGTYHKPYLNLLEIHEEQLSPLVPSGTPIGNLTPQALHDTGLHKNTLVVAGCFDHPAAARAVGVVEPGQLLLSCGTSWVGFFPDRNRQRIIDAELLCDPFLSEQGGPWGAIFSVSRIGPAIDWYIHNVIAPGEADPMQVFNVSAAEAERGAGGVEIDLRETPRRIAAARHNVSRAVMEGAAQLLNEHLYALTTRGIAFEQAVMVGGPSRSPIWPQIVEEITHIKISTGPAHAGARGAAFLAGTGIDHHTNKHEAEP